MDRGSMVHLLGLLSLLSYLQSYCLVTGLPLTDSNSNSECVDMIPEACSTELEPQYCYNQYNRDLCCATCEQLRRPDNPECPFGDRNTLIQEDGETWTCGTYIDVYGKWRCSHHNFRLQCCDSCGL